MMNFKGLCPDCKWVRIISNARGSTFYLCGKAKEIPGWPKYPPQPVRNCRYHEAE